MMMVVDRISHLPDPILGHILSFLPTKNAVATSILSKRWKSTWFSVHNLDFTYFDCGEVKTMKFVQFVERVLLLHDGGSLNKFSLRWYANSISPLPYHSHIVSWINFAITRNVQSLYLCVDINEYVFDIPISAFSCDTLRSLELKAIVLVCDATAYSVCLPRLECLKLDHVDFTSTKACEKLISGCPVLQDLYIYHLDDPQNEELGMPSNVFSCESLRSLELENGYLSVPAAIVVCCTRLEMLKLGSVVFESKEDCEKLISRCPMLQYLYLYISNTYSGDDDDSDIFECIISSASLRHVRIYFEKKSSLVLKASSLESFQVGGDISEIYVEKSLCSLVRADFGIRLVEPASVNNSIVEAVSAFDCAKVLTLSSSVMWALSHATVSFSTEFKRLVRLVVESCCRSLQDFLQNSNSLEDLAIYQHVDCHDHPKWTTPVEVPRSLSNSLKSVRFHDYNGSEDERDMIRYILEHGSVLKAMNISSRFKGDAEKLKLLREICVFPRKSTVCEVHFSW